MNKKSTEPKTLMQKMGFKDNDLKTPEHDYLMMWCSKRENIAKIMIEELDCSEEYIKNGKITVEFEAPLKKEYNENYGTINGRGQIVGFIDCAVNYDPDHFCRYILIEFKSRIPSFGELIREFKYYMSLIRARYVLLTYEDVQTPDGLFESQGITVYKIPRPNDVKKGLFNFM